MRHGQTFSVKKSTLEGCNSGIARAALGGSKRSLTYVDGVRAQAPSSSSVEALLSLVDILSINLPETFLGLCLLTSL